MLTKADGTKFGKTESGTVWIDPKLTSPYAFHQFWLNTEDSKVIEMLKVFSPRGKEEIEELAREVEEAPYKRVAQRTLANDVTDLVHGEDLRKSAEKAAAALFGRGELAELDESTLDAVMGEVQTQKMECGSELPSVVDALAASGVVPSKGQARRTISEGGAYVNNRKVEDAEAKISEEDLLAGKYILLRRGKKTVGGVEIVK